MMSIWKFPLKVCDHQVVSMPKGATILSVQEQGGVPTIWALCNIDAPREDRMFITRGTGFEFDDDSRWIGTVKLGPFVWHVFEEVQ